MIFMSDILFARFGKNDTFIFGIEKPLIGEFVYLDGETYKVVDIKHFPEGGKGILSYKKLKKPFIRVSLSSFK